MNKEFYLKYGVTLLALFAVFLTASSPIVAVPTATPSFGTNAFSTTPQIEFARVVAGEGSAAYANIFAYGGIDGSSYPVDTAATGLAEARSWFIADLQQSSFDSYLQRAPAPVGAPDGLSLHLRYPLVGTTTSERLTWSGEAAQAVEAAYGVTLSLVDFDPVNFGWFVWYNETTGSRNMFSDVSGLSSSGFATLLDSTVLSSAPVAWAGYGARTLDGNQIAQYGAGWVDTDGVVQDGTDSTIYKISTADIFGGAMNPGTGDFSRATITIPYPVEPTAGGISPATSNPLPHVTGIAQWDLAHPISRYALGSQADLQFEFRLKQDQAFPNVRNTFSVNQTKLNVDGILEAKFELENISPTETAEGIELYFPLGPAAQLAKLTQPKTIYTIKPDYYLDVNDGPILFNLQTQLVVPSLSIDDTDTSQVLNYSGWYHLASDDSLANWTSTSTFDLLVDEPVTVSGVSGTISASLTSTGTPTGMPDFVYSILQDIADELAGKSLSEMQAILDTTFKAKLQEAFDTARGQFYQAEDIINVDAGDFNIDTFDYFTKDDSSEQFVYIYNDTVGSLAPGEKKTLTFRITDIPTPDQTFQFMKILKDTQSVTLGGLLTVNYPDVTVTSQVEDYYEVMKYLFARQSYDGRPLSFGFNGLVGFGGLDDLSLSQTFDNYVSYGGIHRYNNTNGYRFFGLSNGQNFQIADEEAVITAQVSLDQQVYTPDDNKLITVNVANNGDTDASNVKVYLYHATLGRDWRFERTQRITSYDVGTLAAGASNSTTISIAANSFVGFSPVFAIVEFDSEAGDAPEAVTDFFGSGDNVWDASGATHHFTYSTLTGALLVPDPADIDLTPTLKEPQVTISNSVDRDENEVVTLTYTITNVGEAETTAYFLQTYDTDFVTFSSTSSSSTSAISLQNENAQFGYGFVAWGNIHLPAKASETITIKFDALVDHGFEFPAARAFFVIASESSLGWEIDTGNNPEVGGTTLSAHSLGLDAGAAAQQQSQKSATEASASSSYSASSSVGASVNTGLQEGKQTVGTGEGFLGYEGAGFLILMAVPATMATFLKRRKH